MQSEELLNINRTLRNLCHDLNQRIQAIAGYSSLLRMDISEDNPLFKDISQIEDQTYKAAHIVNKIHDTIEKLDN
jgi:phosphoglycerate-specific signal transduction histidine kinase